MKNFGFIQKIRLKRAISYFTLLALLVFFAFAVSTNLIGNIARTKAVTHNLYGVQTIGQGDTSKDGGDINIYGTVTIDGEPHFNSLTVKDGGKLISSDYNRYGIYNTNDTSSAADKLFKNSNDQRYAYVMRGFINTGTDHDLTYSVTSGVSNGAVPPKPTSLNPDDFGAIEFFKPVASDLYDVSYWSAANIVDHAYARHSGAGTVQYVDGSWPADVSSDTKPLIPFELRFVNTGDYSDFGITSCVTASVCTTTANNTFIKTVATGTPFISSPTTELKSLVAWQGDGDQTFSTVTSYATMKNWFESTGRYNSDYSAYYRVNNYDFRNDVPIVLGNDTNILTNPVINEAYTALWTSIPGQYARDYANFYPTYDEVSPLAHRVGISVEKEYGYPTISRALYQTFRDNGAIVKPLKITVTGTFTVEGGGMVDLEGRGFASSASGPGVGPGGGVGFTGASHSGLGGYHYDGAGIPAATYDNTPSEPVLPGSGAYSANNDRSAALSRDHYQYGGGYIKVDAGKINLIAGSMIKANGIGGDTNTSGPGPSGGSIVLIDNDASSKYDSMIMAMGSFCRNEAGDSCDYGGGGGGHIFITSKSNLDYLENRKNYSKFYPTNLNTHGTNGVTPSILFNTADYDYWTNEILIPQVILSVSGGTNEKEYSGSAYWATLGQPGRITLNGGSAAYKLKKKLVAVERKGATPITNFNPYALQLDDIIRIEIEVAQVADGSKITDNILKVPNSNSRCEPTINTPIPTGTITAGVSVEWTKAANSPSVFSYQCRVVQ